MFKRHKCPPDVLMTLRINGANVIGPLRGEDLAYMVKYGGYEKGHDLLELTQELNHKIGKVEFLVEYIPMRKR